MALVMMARAQSARMAGRESHATAITWVCRAAMLRAAPLVLLLLALFATGANATIYYVNATGGRNTNLGTSASSPWATLAKVSTYAWSPGFRPGDQVLLTGTFNLAAGASVYLQLDKTYGVTITSANPLQPATVIANQVSCDHIRLSHISLVHTCTERIYGDGRSVSVRAPRASQAHELLTHACM